MRKFDDRQRHSLVNAYKDYMLLLARPPLVGGTSPYAFLSGPKNSDTELRQRAWEGALEIGGALLPIQLPWLAGTQLEFPRLSETAQQLFIYGAFDPQEFSVLDLVLKEGMTFVDVGANAGLYTVFASKKVGETGRVYAMEPSRREFEVLSRNIALNRLYNVSALKLAIGARSEFATLNIAPAQYDGLNSLEELTIFTGLPNLRYSVDRVKYKWESLFGNESGFPIKNASGLEIVIYAEHPFAFDLDGVVIEPASAILGPWSVDGPNELPGRSPRECGNVLAKCALSTFGNIKISEVEGRLRLEGEAGAGVAMRWRLDSERVAKFGVSGRPLPRADQIREEVEVATLDEVFGAHGRSAVDVVKLDIEGWEVNAIRGALRTLEASKPLLLIELASGTESQQRAQALTELLSPFGYTFMEAREGSRRRISLSDDHAPNIIACPDRFVSTLLSLSTTAKPGSPTRVAVPLAK